MRGQPWEERLTTAAEHKHTSVLALRAARDALFALGEPLNWDSLRAFFAGALARKPPRAVLGAEKAFTPVETVAAPPSAAAYVMHRGIMTVTTLAVPSPLGRPSTYTVSHGAKCRAAFLQVP